MSEHGLCNLIPRILENLILPPNTVRSLFPERFIVDPNDYWR